MTKIEVINSRLQAGVWHADLIGVGKAAPQLTARFNQQAIPDPTLTYDPTRDAWNVLVPLPIEMLTDGQQVCTLTDQDGDVIAQMTLMAGAPYHDTLDAEVAQIRAELDMLKSAFRNFRRR
ncbi:MAG: hypothetical protein AAGF56_03285 [Pseudomonadota bacterium]